MRQIKFRGWDKKKKKMIDGVTVIGQNIGNKGNLWVHVVGFMEGEGEKETLMQYTGLKDKNGKEIYEGDLFKETYKAGYSIDEVCFGEYDNGEEYEDNISGNGWYIKEHVHWPEYEMRITEIKDVKNLEVIGNIYENEDLL